MTDEREALEPCPFCGTDDDLHINRVSGLANSWWICCGDCGLTTPNFSSRWELINYWNRRASAAEATSAADN